MRTNVYTAKDESVIQGRHLANWTDRAGNMKES